MRKASREEVTRAIEGGIVFKKSSAAQPSDKNKVKTKAKKKSYVTGAHGSASAKRKAAIRLIRKHRNQAKS